VSRRALAHPVTAGYDPAGDGTAGNVCALPPWLTTAEADRLAYGGVCFWPASDQAAWYRLQLSAGPSAGLRIVTSPSRDTNPPPAVLGDDDRDSAVGVAVDRASPRGWRTLIGVSAAVYGHPVTGEAPIVPLVAHRDRIVLGPILNAPDGPCPLCVFCRFGSTFFKAAAYLDLARACRQFPQVRRRQQAAVRAMLHGTTDIIGSAVRRLLELPAGHFLHAPVTDPAAWQSEPLPTLPHPPGHDVRGDVITLAPPVRWPCRTTRDARPCAFSLVVGPLFRARQLAPGPGEPHAIRISLVKVANLGAFLTWTPDPVGSGVGFSPEATAAAAGEAVERYCGNAAAYRQPQTSSVLLRSRGLRHRPPSRWRLFAAAQYARPGFPFTPPCDDASIGWTTARDLARTRTELVPAAAVWLNYRPQPAEPRCFPVGLAGIAAGRSRRDALRSALLELIERDAATLWWSAGLRATECIIPAWTSLHQQLTAGTRNTTRLWWLTLPTDLPAHVIAGCLHDQARDILAVGFAARLSLAEAIRKATAEAWQLHRVACDLLDPDSTLWRAHADGTINVRLRPYRLDRSYRDAFLPDFSDMTQLFHHAQYYLDPRAHAAALNRLTGLPAVDMAALEANPGRRIAPSRTALVNDMTLADPSLFEADVTSSDMRRAGWRVLRAGSTRLCGNMPAAFPLLGNPRLQHAIELSALGFDPLPCPHA